MRELTELKDLRVLVVGGKPSSVQILRTVFGVAGIGNVAAVAESRIAINLLCSERFTAVFCDDRCESIGGLPFPLAARRSTGLLNPMIPIFLLCSAARRRQVEQARDTGITDVLARPLSAATILRKMRIALIKPRPFIAAPDFFGPDRRVRERGPIDGEERRKRAAKKVKFTLKDAPEPVLE
jgi:two-component system chemotaxis response regulator CheY